MPFMSERQQRKNGEIAMRSPTAVKVCKPAERVIVVSLMKSGTHLIQELMIALGYGIYGQSRIPPEIRPKLDSATRKRTIRMVYGEEAATTLEAGNEASLGNASDRAWDTLGWVWQMKFGMPLVNRYGSELVDDSMVRQAWQRTISTNFSETPAGVCWILPEFDIRRIDGRFLQEWSQTGEPRIIFNYRDPRDVALSMVNFLSGKTAAGFGNFSEFKAFGRILESMRTMDERLTYSLTDPSFPGYADFEKELWLLRHPDVCKVSFEEMVGARGGGSAEQQCKTVQRVADFLDIDIDPGSVAERLFREDAFSFFKGQIGSWRKAFTSEHESLFHNRFGHVLEAYGYK